MKKILFSVSVIALAFFACDKKEIEQKITFELKQNAPITIPAYTFTDSTLTVEVDSIITNTQKLADDNKVSLDDIKEIKINSVKLTILDPDTQKFTFGKTFSVAIKADGLGETVLASKDPVPSDAGTTLTLDVTNIDVVGYVKKDMVGVKVTIGVDEALPHDTKVKVDLVYTVNGVVKVKSSNDK